MSEPQRAQVACEEKRKFIEAACASLDGIAHVASKTTERWKTEPPTIEELDRFSEEFERSIRLHQGLMERYDAHVRKHGC